jgi:hypothetical protein
MSPTEQQVNIKYCVEPHESPSEILRMLEEACCEVTMKETQAYEWHKHFRDGSASVNDDQSRGQPSTSTNDENSERVRNNVLSNRRKSIKGISVEVGISMGSVHSIWTCITFIMGECILLRMQQWISTTILRSRIVVLIHALPLSTIGSKNANSWTQRNTNVPITMADQDDDFLNNVIIGDGTWCFLQDLQPKS